MASEGLSKEAFLEMAALMGVDMSDREYLDLLYEDVKGVFRLVSILDEPDLSGIEQAPVFSTGYGPGAPGQGRW